MVWAQFGTWGPSYEMNFLGKLELHLQGLYFKQITKIPTRNHVKFFANKHLKNTILTSVKLMQMELGKQAGGFSSR